jgi:hypothetical protein
MDKKKHFQYMLSSKELDELNSYIEFPPTPSMKDVVMYPSYDEIIRKVNDE